MNNEDTDQVSSNVTCVNIYMYIFICTKFFEVSKNEYGNKKTNVIKNIFYEYYKLKNLLKDNHLPSLHFGNIIICF